ncbi:PepSY domain-containing protein [Neobacillus terrae]|uniref:PepSY domain-containing protein n=1 Tax=Neobacillus terrae TaxID=3034837 RepID=UPI00140D2993|nr:PepSY domain-containing protein [Neobacillus terrae]NHM34106.1 PepSY domain-containing protein [Neobacillus terrae]
MNRIIRKIHRITGIIGSFLVLVMAITGLLLNHRTLIGYDSDKEMMIQKFIFALHSGRIGHYSILWLTDLASLCMVVLSITGICIWFKSSHEKHH